MSTPEGNDKGSLEVPDAAHVPHREDESAGAHSPLGESEKVPAPLLEGESVGEAKPISLYEFIRYFYTGKHPISEKYRGYFKDLQDTLSGNELNSLLSLARENDPDFGRTLSVAEFVLETSGQSNHRDKVMDFAQRVASQAGSLASTGKNTVFQDWLENNRAATDKLSVFYGKIERITDGKDRQGNPKKLAKKPKENLGCIAAMWLYHKGEATPPQLISHLMRSGMNLRGEAGQQVESRAFAFVASMVKSTNKRKFAYFVDYVGKNEARLTAQIRQGTEVNRELSREAANLRDSLRSVHSQLDREQQEKEGLQLQVDELRRQLHELEEQRKHDSVHHGATIESADSQFNTVLKELAEHLRLARTALDRGPEKRHIVQYQLEEMADIVSKGIK